MSRDAASHELDVLQRLLNEERSVVAANESIVKARTRTPMSTFKLRTKDKTELAAWFAVANALLNMDETMTQ